jgi:hypothetical protein
LALKEGEPISVYGQIAGSVDGPRSGTKIPEVLADFVIKRSK